MAKSSNRMKQVITKLAREAGADIETVGKGFTVESKCFMPVNVTRTSTTTIAVSHTYIMNGDVVSDPDMEFYIGPMGSWYACHYQDYYGYQRSLELAPGSDGKLHPVTIKRRLQAQHAQFASMWVNNIARQGFYAAAQESTNVKLYD